MNELTEVIVSLVVVVQVVLARYAVVLVRWVLYLNGRMENPKLDAQKALHLLKGDLWVDAVDVCAQRYLA